MEKKHKDKQRAQYLDELDFRQTIPFWNILDIDQNPYRNAILIFLFRLIMQMV